MGTPKITSLNKETSFIFPHMQQEVLNYGNNVYLPGDRVSGLVYYIPDDTLRGRKSSVFWAELNFWGNWPKNEENVCESFDTRPSRLCRPLLCRNPVWKWPSSWRGMSFPIESFSGKTRIVHSNGKVMLFKVDDVFFFLFFGLNWREIER